jgi:hypothetical protein
LPVKLLVIVETVTCKRIKRGPSYLGHRLTSAHTPNNQGY